MSYTTKKDFWGNTIYIDDRGNEIGRRETSWLGTPGVYKNGVKVADLQTDYNDNENIIFRSNSFFGHDTIIEPKNKINDWDFCDNCGEYLYGADEDDCDCHH